MKPYIIIAPHADDEIIGCFEILQTGSVETVLLPSLKGEIISQILASSEHFLFGLETIDSHDFYKHKAIIYLFPDPTYETHPEHRRIGMIGEALLRVERQVIFYSTNMLAPYVHEVTEPDIKRECLDSLYPNKKELWEYDHKYFLFEGYTRWIMKFNN